MLPAAHHRSQALHYEKTDYIEPKLKALKILERWVVAESAVVPA